MIIILLESVEPLPIYKALPVSFQVEELPVTKTELLDDPEPPPMYAKPELATTPPFEITRLLEPPR
jgi:hypothetical protein